jgi:hypothetical protein
MNICISGKLWSQVCVSDCEMCDFKNMYTSVNIYPVLGDHKVINPVNLPDFLVEIN